MNSPVTQINTTPLHLKENQYLSHEDIIIHPSIIHLNNHISQLIPDLIPHKSTTTLLTYPSNFSFARQPPLQYFYWRTTLCLTSQLASLHPYTLINSLIHPPSPRYKSCTLIAYYNVFITCHVVFL